MSTKNNTRGINHRSRPRRRGVLMLLALLVMASITATGIATSVIITTTHQQSKNLSNYIGASLAADSGIERALAVLKNGRVAADMAPTLAAATILPGTPENLTVSKANFYVDASPSATATTLKLNAGQSFAFDILATDQTKMRVRSFTDSCGACAGALEIAWTVISKTGDTAYSNRRYASWSGINDINLLEVRSSGSNTAGFISGNNYLGFRIKVTAMPNHNISNLTVAPCLTSTPNCNSFAGEVPLVGKVKIESTGRDETGTSVVTKTAEVLWQPPASGFFNYVLFTEGKIEPA